MKLVDTNVLVDAVNTASTHHDRARRWMEVTLSGGAPVGFAWIALIGFVRIVTAPRLLPHPLGHGLALDQVDDWLAAPPAHLLHPGQRHADLLRDALDAVGGAGNLTNDAHLAALAKEHKATVVTFDRDFGRFPGVRWEVPG